MSIKAGLKTVFGEARLSSAKGQVYHYRTAISRFIHRTPSMRYDHQQMQLWKVFSELDYHVFRGYYDIDYFNRERDRFLCHRINLRSCSRRNALCELGYYDLENDRFVKIAETGAWCWQQGARLRWHPLDDKKILFNDVREDGNRYVTRIWDTAYETCTDILPQVLYDVAPDFSYGISLNFSRLQRLRPGYGYSCSPDLSAEDPKPDNDGIFLLDLRSRESRLLYSLEDLSRDTDDKDAEHYVNHISIAPDGEHFLFFHLIKRKGTKGWKARLFISDREGKELSLLEGTDRVSHYSWMDSRQLMMTLQDSTGREYYAVYEIDTRCRKAIIIQGLDVDGHPGLLESPDLYLTDTYPLRGGWQYLKVFSLTDVKARRIAQIYHDYRMRGEKRCDLHPSVDASRRFISVDTTCWGGRRSVLVFQRDLR